MIQRPCTDLSHKCNLLRKTLQVKRPVSEKNARRFQFLKFRKLHRKTICVWVSWPATLLKRDFNTGVHKISKNTFFIEQLQWLFLKFNSCFQRSPGEKPMRLSPISPIHTRFGWKRYLLPRKSRSNYRKYSVKEGLQLY